MSSNRPTCRNLRKCLGIATACLLTLIIDTHSAGRAEDIDDVGLFKRQYAMRYVRRKYKNLAAPHFKLLAIDCPANMAAHHDRNLLTRVLVNRDNTTLVELHFCHKHLITLDPLAG